MLSIREYQKAESLEQAWTLNQKRQNRILGGTGWLKLGTRTIGTAIDLCNLGLNTIEETETTFSIGCMVTLRQLECHTELNAATGGALRESLRHIVGVQFRNCATIGGSIWGRFGFSDPLTCLLALDTQVELYQGGIVPLAEWLSRAPDRDILVRIILNKTGRRAAYAAFRNSATDFPVLTCCVSVGETGWRASIGARPARAQLLVADTAADLYPLAEKLRYGSNTRGTEDYRRHLSGVLLGRCVRALEEETPCESH